MIRPLGDEDDWMDAPLSGVGSVSPLNDRPKKKVKKREFPIGFEIPQPPPEKPKRRPRKKDR